MKIGILQTGYVPEELAGKHGEYPEMFIRALSGNGFEFSLWRVLENEFPKSVNEADGWLVTGSKHGAYEGLAWMRRLEDFIREAYSSDIALVGICFGHQIIAQALGGKVSKFADGWGMGQTAYEMDGKRVELMAMHQDQVIEKPAEAEIIATNDFCTNAGFAYRGSNGIKALSFQPHPEFSSEFMRELISLRAGEAYPEELAKKPLASITENDDSSMIVKQISDFFLARAHGS